MLSLRHRQALHSTNERINFMKLKKLVCLLLTTIILLSLVSCSHLQPVVDVAENAWERVTDTFFPNPMRKIEKADQALLESPYVATMEIEMSCDDTMYEDLFEITDANMKFYSNNGNTQIAMTISGVTVNLTFVEDTVYYHAYGYGESIKQKVTLTDEQKKELLGDYGATPSIDILESATMEMELVEDGRTIITCTNLSEDIFNEVLELNLDASKTKASIEDIVMKLVIKDGKYEKATFEATYVYKIKNEEVEVDVVMEILYSYADVKEVTKPNDVNKYKKSTYDELFGD